MKSRLSFTDRATCRVVRSARQAPADPLDPKGYFLVEHYRNGEKIGEYRTKNTIVNEGRNKLLDVMFHSATQITTWYIGLIDNDGVSAPIVSNTYAAIRTSGSANNWDEMTAGAYEISGDDTIRATWNPDAASGQEITNSTPLTFTITSTGDGMTVYGLFVCGGHADCEDQGNYDASGGVLWCGTAFSGDPIPVLENDELKVTYTVDANAS